MKKVIATIVTLAVTATGALAATSVADLTNDEQAAHRIGECRAISSAVGGSVRNKHNSYRKVVNVLTKPGAKYDNFIFPATPLSSVQESAYDDATIAIAIGKLTADFNALTECQNDILKIAADDYKPSFVKPTQTAETKETKKPEAKAPKTKGNTLDVYSFSSAKTEAQRDTFFKANKGKKFTFTGRVRDVEAGGWILGPSVSIQTGVPGVVVSCDYPKDSTKVNHVSKGSTFTCEGTLTNYVFLWGGANVGLNSK